MPTATRKSWGKGYLEALVLEHSAPQPNTTDMKAPHWSSCFLLYCVLCSGTSNSGSSVHGIFQARILAWVLQPWVGCYFILQIFPTQGSNPRLLCLLPCCLLSPNELPKSSQWSNQTSSDHANPILANKLPERPTAFSTRAFFNQSS